MPHGEDTVRSERTERHEYGLGLLLQLTLVLARGLQQNRALDGLTTSRARVLWELHSRGPSVQRTLADALTVTARTMTGLIDGLVASGFVTRERHPTDRRAALVTSTSHGAAAVAAMERDREQLVQIMFGGMADDRLDCLIEGLGELVSRLDTDGAELPEVDADRAARSKSSHRPM